MPNAPVSRFNLRCSNVVHLFPNRHVIALYVFRLHTSCFYWMWLLLSCCCRKDVVWKRVSSIKRKAQCADEGKRNKCIINNGHTPKHIHTCCMGTTQATQVAWRESKRWNTHTHTQTLSNIPNSFGSTLFKENHLYMWSTRIELNQGATKWKRPK